MSEADGKPWRSRAAGHHDTRAVRALRVRVAEGLRVDVEAPATGPRARPRAKKIARAAREVCQCFGDVDL